MIFGRQVHSIAFWYGLAMVVYRGAGLGPEESGVATAKRKPMPWQ
jgi:hypothetical protein